MDTVTHVLLGASVAQLPKSTDQQDLTFTERAFIGGLAGIFPDIDYLLFLWNPLDFLAYWHRAETHSLILAPVWAILLTFLLSFWQHWKPHKRVLFYLILSGILSHNLIDSFTTFGTQWFAPLNEYRVSWDLLFVVDGYFSFTILSCFFWLYWRPSLKVKLLPFILPAIYLSIVAYIKFSVEKNFISAELNLNHSSRAYSLPQPFSPFYWQLITQEKKEEELDENVELDGKIHHAYVRFTRDPVAEQLSLWLNQSGYQEYFQSQLPLQWKQAGIFSVSPAHIKQVNAVWHNPDFKAFRDFASVPVLLELQQNHDETCVWFSDLRYHWPTFPPAFRYGMCRHAGAKWQLFRIPYFANHQDNALERRAVR